MSNAKWQACPVCNGDGIVEGREYDRIIGIQCTACNSEHLIHIETGLPPTRHRALVERTEVQGFEYDPKLYENSNDRLPRMKNPPPPPPIKGKSRSHVL